MLDGAGAMAHAALEPRRLRNLAASQILADALEDLKMKQPQPAVDLASVRTLHEAALADPAHPDKTIAA